MVSPEGKSIIDRAKRIYADRLQLDLERDHFSRFVSIEPESGEFFLGDSLDEAVQLAVKKYPSRRKTKGSGSFSDSVSVWAGATTN
jgi:hypothetical protein